MTSYRTDHIMRGSSDQAAITARTHFPFPLFRLESSSIASMNWLSRLHTMIVTNMCSRIGCYGPRTAVKAAVALVQLPVCVCAAIECQPSVLSGCVGWMVPSHICPVALSVAVSRETVQSVEISGRKISCAARLCGRQLRTSAGSH